MPTRLPLCRGSDEGRTRTGGESCEGDSRAGREPVVASQWANDTDDFYFATLVSWSVRVNEDSRDVRERKHRQQQNEQLTNGICLFSLRGGKRNLPVGERSGAENG